MTHSLFPRRFRSGHHRRVLTASEAPLSKEQKAFNNSLPGLPTRRAGSWPGGVRRLEVFRRRCAGELVPREERQADLQAGLARALHAAHGQKG